jgi:hypothetical protein
MEVTASALVAGVRVRIMAALPSGFEGGGNIWMKRRENLTKK